MKKAFCILAAVFFCLCMTEGEARAAAETVEVNLPEARQECVFEVRWEETETEAQVRITGPDGSVYGTEETPDRVTEMEGAAYFYIGDAAAGRWQVTVEGDSLGNVEVNAGSLPQSLKIDSFTVTENGRGIYEASWSVSDCPEDVTVEIFADTDQQGYDGTRAASGGRGPSGTLSFDMPGVDSGYYYFYITVAQDSGIFNSAYCDTAFFYDNINGGDKLSNVTASLLNRDVYMSWTGEENGFYRVMLFDPDTKLLLASTETEETSCVLSMPEGYDRVLAAAASWKNEQLGRFDVFEISADSAVEASVAYPEEQATNQSVIFAEVSYSGNCTVSATRNGELLMENETAQGRYEIHLLEGDNAVVFLITDEAGNTASFLKDIYLDSTPPQLSLKRNLDKISTGESYIYVEGYTEAGVTLTCNGEPVELAGSYFSFRQPLSFGTNEIVLTATDVAGNEARYSAEVSRPFWRAGIVKWILLAAAAAALIALETVILVRGKRRSRR